MIPDLPEPPAHRRNPPRLQAQNSKFSEIMQEKYCIIRNRLERRGNFPQASIFTTVIG
jgi:hypothetical protein